MSETPSLIHLLTLNPARDAEGRALLESLADQEALDEIRASYETCPYEDSPSRLGHEKPMNTAALEQAKRNFAGMLAVLRHLRELHLGSVDRWELVAADWRRICILGEILPRFLLLRRHLTTGGALGEYYGYRVPADVSTLFKTVRGLAKLLDWLIDHPTEVATRLSKEDASRLGIQRPRAATRKGDRRGKKAPPKPLTGDALDAYRAAHWTMDDLVHVAETFDLYVGETEVCAAPTNMVRATLGSLMEGKNPHEEVQLDEDVRELLGDGLGFLEFCDTLDRFYRDLREFKRRCEKSVTRLMAEVRRLSPSQHGRALALYLDGFDRYLVAERDFLEVARRAQAALLRAAGHEGEPPPLGLEAIDEMVPDNRRKLARDAFGVHVTHGERTIDVAIRSGDQEAVESVPWTPS